MQIRKAASLDFPNIVSLLKISLGESLMPKSENYWVWKHVNNPFGESPVLLAEEDGQLIGVRAFMQWKWQRGNQVINAVRAVDTATHPGHQGKGIFTKLTKSLLEECNREGFSLVFNTPNEKSLPGYLKMGWEKSGRLPVALKAVIPFHMPVFNQESSAPDIRENLNYYLNHKGLPDLLSQFSGNTYWTTARSIHYLKWRYEKVPVVSYLATGIESQNELAALAIYRIKKLKFVCELRISDIFYSNRHALKVLMKSINRLSKIHGAHVISFADTHRQMPLSLLAEISRPMKLGPIVTVRDIQPGGKLEFSNFNSWAPSLGDLELF